MAYGGKLMCDLKIKKLVSLLLVCLILLSQFLLIDIRVNAESDDVKFVAYPNPTSTANSIYSGNEFEMVLIVQNLSGVKLENINIDIDGSSSFSPLETIPVIDSIAISGQSKNTYKFTYDGGSNKLQAIITYKKGSSECQQETSVTIARAKPDSTTPSTPVDTNKYAPKIIIANNSALPTGQAGSEITYTLPVKNIAKYPAKNIVISPVLDDSIPIVIESMNISQTIDSLKSNETKEVIFKFTISETADKKIYALKFNIQCNNYYSNDYFSSSETGYLKVDEVIKRPNLVLQSVSTNPSPVHAGDRFKLDLKLENTELSSAKDVSVTLLGLKNDGASIIGTSNKQVQSSISGHDTTTFTFDLAASKKIEIGANNLKIKLDYKDSSNSSFSDEIEFFFNVQDSNNISNIELKNIVSPSTSLKPGDSELIAFDVANTGTTDVQNVKVSISSDKEIIPRTINTIIIPSLKRGETNNTQFQLFVSDEATTKNYPIAITVEYDIDINGTKTKQSVMQYVGFYVENKTGKSVPKLIIDKYSLEPKTLKAGQQFELKLSILNTSKSSTINNIKVSLFSEDGTFSTIDSNSFYIDSISPKARLSKKVSFSSKPDAPAKQYMISINYEYEDEKGTALTSKDSIGIPIAQAPKFVIGELNIPTEAFVGIPIPVNLSFYNMGKSTLYNLMVKLDGKFKVEGSSYFVGNFEPGKTDTFDSTIIPDAPGIITGNVLFTYEDADGKTQEVRKEISVNIMEMPPQEGIGEGQTPPVKTDSKIPLWAYIAGGIVVLAIIVIVILVIRKKIKARKELMFDEEL